MFLFFEKFEPKLSYKHGSYKTKSVYWSVCLPSLPCLPPAILLRLLPSRTHLMNMVPMSTCDGLSVGLSAFSSPFSHGTLLLLLPSRGSPGVGVSGGLPSISSSTSLVGFKLRLSDFLPAEKKKEMENSQCLYAIKRQVTLLVHWSVHWLVGWSIGRSIGWSVTIYFSEVIIRPSSHSTDVCSKCVPTESYFFLVANKRLYIRVCPSVCWSVGPSIRPSRVFF